MYASFGLNGCCFSQAYGATGARSGELFISMFCAVLYFALAIGAVMGPMVSW